MLDKGQLWRTPYTGRTLKAEPSTREKLQCIEFSWEKVKNLPVYKIPIEHVICVLLDVRNGYKSGEKRGNNLVAKIERHVDAPFPETHLPRKAWQQ